jgi:glycosyltransferase involved in cell wall biosynthesis
VTLRWWVVIPVYNEHDFLRPTLEALARQTRPFRLILVDNGSRDGSVALAARTIAELGLDGRILIERRPGPVFALARGLAEADGEFVATCDADTYYPPDYLATAERLFEARPEAGTVCAYFLPPASHPFRAGLTRFHQLAAAFLLPRQAHNGGAGQCFRAATLEAAGGYGDHWPYVLADHEIIHRMAKGGRVVWNRDHWCSPSDRRTNGDSVRWSLTERILYHLTPFRLKDWYFYDFLSARLDSRGLHCARLRERNWAHADDEAADALCG